MTAENTTAAADTSAPDLQEVPSETTNLDSMTVSEPKAADSMVRPFVSDTMPDGILYRVEQGETLTDILKNSESASAHWITAMLPSIFPTISPVSRSIFHTETASASRRTTSAMSSAETMISIICPSASIFPPMISCASTR